MEPDKELEKLQQEFAAARDSESAATRLINNSLEDGGKDIVALQKATEEMLQAHRKSMGYYLEMLKHKLKSGPRVE